jgi:hypothetical protein
MEAVLFTAYFSFLSLRLRLGSQIGKNFVDRFVRICNFYRPVWFSLTTKRNICWSVQLLSALIHRPATSINITNKNQQPGTIYM